jgi:hypothetical protein
MTAQAMGDSFFDGLSLTVVDLSVPRTHPPSSGNHPVLVDEAAQTIGSSYPGEVDVAGVRRSRVESGRRTLVERPVGTVAPANVVVPAESGPSMATRVG